MTDRAEAPAGVFDDPRERSLPDDVKDLIAQARTYATAEIAFQKSRLAYAAGAARAIAVFAVLALVLMFFVLMGLVFGLILALATPLTPWGATAVVCGGLLLLALLCAWLALRRSRALRRAIGDKP